MTTWDDLTARAESDADRARLDEVPALLRDHYAAAVGELVENAAPDRALRGTFARWADAVVRVYGGDDAERANLRAWLSDPSRYPGGVDELRADAIHLEALRRTRVAAFEAQQVATLAQSLADETMRTAERAQRGGCAVCARKRGDLRDTYLPGTALAVTVCGSCAEHLPELRTEYGRKLRPALEW